MTHKLPTAMLAAAVVICGSAFAQSETLPQREAVATHAISAGSIVQSPAGKPIGRVQDIVPDTNSGAPAYVVIATRSGSAAVPYTVISPMVENGHVVLDRTKLESAPRVGKSQLRENGDAQWKRQADRYWSARNPPNLR